MHVAKFSHAVVVHPRGHVDPIRTGAMFIAGAIIVPLPIAIGEVENSGGRLATMGTFRH
jgi:hypothetical protein